jgi:bifunctional DNase/RNase
VTAGAEDVQVQVVGIFGERLELGDQEHQVPLLVLRDTSDRELRIPVSSCEGLGIHLAVEQQTVPRPLTHDLAVRVINKLSAAIERVVIDRLSDQESHATVHLHTDQGSLAVDARPGDAVALAVRAEAPVFVKGALLEQAGLTGGGDTA